MTDLNSLARKLAQRAVVYCPTTYFMLRDRFEAVIREAIERTIDEAVETAKRMGREFQEGRNECRQAGAVNCAYEYQMQIEAANAIATEIRSLKQSNSGMEVRK